MSCIRQGITNWSAIPHLTSLITRGRNLDIIDEFRSGIIGDGPGGRSTMGLDINRDSMGRRQSSRGTTPRMLVEHW